ncbi:eukaryotic peptide chain release factor GTP-binding subunit-like [Trichoplusia ni]|uniref:Eukaryotic peptide chain release factor GTP-binding subunit-like n=1 Tax=Trichoplusia ni TaxID=7111 RepID=A0A7E5VQN4_TRINI|nr:eukaryotic peptide chain release factor GTP-binding subunit-like [Trichoplusia ni]
MKVTWVFLLALGVVAADIGIGYHYKVPETSYGVPSYQLGGNSGQYNTAYTGSSSSSIGSQAQSGYQYNHGHQANTGYQQANTGYQQANTGYQQANTGYQQANNGYQAENLQSASGSGSSYYQNLGANQAALGTGFQTQYQSSSQYQSAQKYQIQQQPAQIFKHFYVHAAPEDPEPPRPRAPIVLPPPQKHYKIIFVKTPSEASSQQVIAPVQPQHEEKTIVYVLVKKPDEPKDLVLPKIEQKPPSKPEVYFIKYKNKEDSQAVINNIVQDYNKGQSVALADSGSESSYESGQGNVQYQTPAVSHDSSSTGSFGSQSFGVSGSSANSGYNLGESNIASSISAPHTVSSTASSTGYEGASSISTSQGVPHETYGPPKFRESY